MRWFLAAAVSFSVVTLGHARLLFQDQHFTPDGHKVIYNFESDTESISRTINPKRAGQIGVNWAIRFYRLDHPRLVSVAEKKNPNPFWLVRINGLIDGKRDQVYAVVAPNGGIVEPAIGVKPAIAAIEADGQILKRPAPEIHGEISYTFATGKGFLPYGSWYGPYYGPHPFYLPDR
jgi:hypothetical protein